MAFSSMLRGIVFVVINGEIMKVVVSIGQVDILKDVPVQQDDVPILVLLPEDGASNEAGPGVRERANTLNDTHGGKQVPQQLLHEAVGWGRGKGPGGQGTLSKSGGRRRKEMVTKYSFYFSWSPFLKMLHIGIQIRISRTT